MKAHFVTFYSPGSFVAEESTKPIESWDVEAAQKMAQGIEERHGAIPYGFRFTTRSRGPDDLDSKESARSPFYWLPHCKVETIDEVAARDDPSESILRTNMRCNGWKRVITTTKGWKWTQPLGDGDVVLASSSEVKMP